MTWIDDNKRPLMAVGAILGVAWFGGRYFDKNQSYGAEMFDAEYDFQNTAIHTVIADNENEALPYIIWADRNDPDQWPEEEWTVVDIREAETFEAEKEGLYFVFADGKTMMGLEDNYNAVYLEWKIPYSQIRDYVNEYTDDLWSWEDQEWRLGDGPYDIAYDFAHGKSAPDIFTEPFGEEYSSSPYTMEWATEIEDAVKSRIWEVSDNYNDVVDLDDKMTKAEIRSFLTGIPSWRKEIAKRAETFEARNYREPTGNTWAKSFLKAKKENPYENIEWHLMMGNGERKTIKGVEYAFFSDNSALKLKETWIDGELDDVEWVLASPTRIDKTSGKGVYGAETFEAKGYKGISASKIKVLEKYIENGGQALDYHELPYHTQRQLEMGRVHELLYQDVNRWLQDNAHNPHHAMPSWLSAETFEAKGDCEECYGTGGLYDSHMGINDECHSCGGTGFDY